MKKTLRKAFTLIELMVVIAIIAVLAGLLMPAAQKGRERGRQAKCVGNARSISQALFIKATDNAQKFPDWDNSRLGGKSMVFNMREEGYIKEQAVFECPSDRGSSFSQAGYPGSDTTQSNNSSYVYACAQVGSGQNVISNVANMRLSLINNVSKKAVVFEPTLFTARSDSKTFWHVGIKNGIKQGGVVGFADGHADLITITNGLSSNQYQ